MSADIIRRSGILRGHDSSTGSSNGSDQATSAPHDLQEAVDHAMRRLASYLLSGNSYLMWCCFPVAFYQVTLSSYFLWQCFPATFFQEALSSYLL